MRFTRTSTFVLAVVSVLLLTSTASAGTPPPLLWARQFGTPSNEYTYGLASGGLGSLYITGYTEGDLGGQTNAGGQDAFICKYDSAGQYHWTRLLGHSWTDVSQGRGAADAFGNGYITGCTFGELGGLPNAGGEDVFLRKYNPAGVTQWTKQFGTSAWDFGWGAAVDASGNVYVTGYTGGNLGGQTNAGGDDAFLNKYSPDGAWQWTRLLGSSSRDHSVGVGVDGSGYVYIAGSTRGNLGGPNVGDDDIFLAKYDSAGQRQWTRHLGSSSPDFCRGVAVDASGNLYMTGVTYAHLGGQQSAGMGDALLCKYSSAGVYQWTRLLGFGATDVGNGVAVDASGNVYMIGETRGSLGGQTNAGKRDAFLSKYDSSGVCQWSMMLGTPGDEFGNDVAVDAFGNVYITGYTWGDLFGPNAGMQDGFIAKFVPEPATLLLLAFGACLPLLRRRR